MNSPFSDCWLLHGATVVYGIFGRLSKVAFGCRISYKNSGIIGTVLFNRRALSMCARCMQEMVNNNQKRVFSKFIDMRERAKIMAFIKRGEYWSLRLLAWNMADAIYQCWIKCDAMWWYLCNKRTSDMWWIYTVFMDFNMISRVILSQPTPISAFNAQQ